LSARRFEHGARAGVPGSVRVRVGVPQLVEHASALLEHDDVAITGGVLTALDWRARGYRVTVRGRTDRRSSEVHLYLRLVGGHDRVRDAVGAFVPEVGMQVGARPDRRDVLRGERAQREVRDFLVPRARGRKDRAATGPATEAVLNRRARERARRRGERDGGGGGKRGQPRGKALASSLTWASREPTKMDL